MKIGDRYWYTSVQLAERWGVPEELVEHYLELGKLRMVSDMPPMDDDPPEWVYPKKEPYIILLREVERFERGEPITATTSGAVTAETGPVKESTRTIENLQKALVAVAIDCYGYDPRASKNTAVKDIQAALDKIGLSLTENTIRTHLKAGAQMIPPTAEK